MARMNLLIFPSTTVLTDINIERGDQCSQYHPRELHADLNKADMLVLFTLDTAHLHEIYSLP